MSELRQQLNYLKTVFPETNAPKLPSGVKETFLFDGKKAAQISMDSIYSIAMDGLYDLINTDARFRPFADTIFSNKMVQFNRELQSKEVNEELDDSIASFLRLLSPYFLLRSAHKVLEFLIRRYKVHVYNVDAIMECVIPYHESLYFSRLVQILAVSNTMWHFLEPIQKSGAALHREVLLQRYITDFNILEFVCQAAKRAVELKIENKTLVSFYTVSVVEYIEATKLQDVYLKRLLPFIFDGIKADEKDFRASSYIILTQITSKVELIPAALHTCMNTISKSLTDYNLEEALVCLIFLFQSQKIELMPLELFRKLIELKNFERQLLLLSQQYNIENFLRGFSKALVEYALSTKDTTLLQRVIQHLPFGPVVPSITKLLFDRYLVDKDLRDTIKEVLTTIERRFPTEMDKGVYLAMERSSTEEQELVIKFVQLTFSQTKHQYMKETNSTLFLSLEHPDPNVRLLAIKELQSLASNSQDKEFVSQSLLSKLGDDSMKVIKSVLQFPSLVEVVDPEQLLTKVSTLFLKLKKEANLIDAKEVLPAAASVLLNKELSSKVGSSYVEQVLPVVLEFLFATEKYQTISLSVYKSLGSIQHPLLEGLAKALERPEKIARDERNKLVINKIAQNLVQNSSLVEQSVKLINDNIAQQLLVLALGTAFKQSGNVEIAIALYGAMKTHIGDATSIVPVSIYTQPLLAPELASYTLDTILKSLKFNSDLSGLQSFSSKAEPTDMLSLLQHLYVNLAGSKFFTSLLQFVKLIFSAHLKEHTIQFLSSFWSSEVFNVNTSVQERSLLMANALIGQSKQTDYQTILPSILVAFASESYSVRYAALCLLKTLKDTSDNLKSNTKVYMDKITPKESTLSVSEFLKLVNNILTKEQDLLADHASLPLVVQHAVKSSKSETVVPYILNNVLSAKSNYAKYILFKLLDNVSTSKKLEFCYSLLQQLISNVEQTRVLGVVDYSLLSIMLSRCFSTDNMKIVSGDEKYFNMFIHVLESCKPVTIATATVDEMQEDEDEEEEAKPKQEIEVRFLCLDVVGSITPDFYKSLSPALQTRIFSTLCNVLRSSTDLDVSTRFQQVCKVLPATCETITTCIPGIVKETTKANMDKLVGILEIILLMNEVKDKAGLTKPIFDILNFFISGKVAIQDVRVEYATNIILSVLNDIAGGLAEKQESEKAKTLYDVESIIACLKASPQVRNHAIMLLGTLSSLLPEQVLKNIVSLLSVMEKSLKQKDAFTYDIIEKTILQIVPQVLERKMSINQILNVLISSFTFIPEERRLKLFASIVKLISRKKIHIVVIKLLEQAVENEAFSSFCHKLIAYFKIPKQLICIHHLLKFAAILQSPAQMTADQLELYNAQDAGYEANKKFSKLFFDFSTQFLSSLDFLKLLFDEEQTDNAPTQKIIRNICQHLITTETTFIASKEEDNDFSSNIASVQETLAKVQQLLTASSFIDIAKNILAGPNTKEKSKILDLLNVRLADNTTENSKSLKQDKADVVSMISVFGKILSKGDSPVGILQSVIVGIELIVRRFAEDVQEKLPQVIPQIVSRLTDDNMHIIGSAALCLATISAQSKTAIIPFFPSFFPKIVSKLSELLTANDKATTLLRVVLISAMEVIVKKHLQFISPYVSDILLIIVHPSVINSSNKKVVQKSASILEFLQSSLEVRLILQPTLSAYQAALLYGQESMLKLLETANHIIGSFTAQHVDQYQTQIVKFFLTLFDLRRVHIAKLKNIEEVEAAVLNLFTTYVLKLNENLFKPLLQQLVSWARKSRAQLSDSADDYADEQTKPEESPHLDRLIMFYKAIATITTTIKSIAVPFFALFLDNIIQDIKDCKSNAATPLSDEAPKETPKKRKRAANTESGVTDLIIKKHQVLNLIFASLEKCFTHDDEGFMQNKTRFDSLYLPLVDQLENVGLGTVEMFKERVDKYLAPCLGQLAACIPHGFWKALQFAVLLKSQNQKVSWIKYAALVTLENFYVKVGQEFIVTLPEMIPYVAEMMEDDDEMVVEQVKTLIVKVEQITGENIRDNLTK